MTSLCKLNTRTWYIAATATMAVLDMSADADPNRYIIVKNNGTTAVFVREGVTSAALAGTVFPTATAAAAAAAAWGFGKIILPGHAEAYEKTPDHKFLAIVLESGTGNVSISNGGNE